MIPASTRFVTWSFTLVCLCLATTAALTSCNSGDLTLADVDPNAVGEASYEQVRAIFKKNCVPCHQTDNKPGGILATAGEQQDDELEDVDLESCEGIQEYAGEAVRVLLEDTMPPGAWPRLTEAQKLTISNWLSDGACAPCNPCEN